MLDLVYLIAMIALFAIVGLVAKGVERLGPPAVSRDTQRGEEQR